MKYFKRSPALVYAAIAVVSASVFATSPLVRQLDCFNKNPTTIASKSGECACSSTNLVSARRQDAPEVFLDTPEARFSNSLTIISDGLVKNGADPADIVIEDMVKISWTNSTGNTFSWSFDKEGYLLEFGDSTAAVRYHKEGNPAYGFDLKMPSAGFPEFTTLVSTEMDSRGYILSFTWHPTNVTTIVPLPAGVDRLGSTSSYTSNRSANTSMEILTPATKKQKLRDCNKACEHKRNDDPEVSRSEYNNCKILAGDAYNRCIAAGAGNISKWAAIWGTLGAAFGTVIAPGEGTIIGGLGGASYGSLQGAALTYIECGLIHDTALNTCNKLFQERQRLIKTQYYTCLSRCEDDYKQP